MHAQVASVTHKAKGSGIKTPHEGTGDRFTTGTIKGLRALCFKLDCKFLDNHSTDWLAHCVSSWIANFLTGTAAQYCQ
jgi:hypothetical protein